MKYLLAVFIFLSLSGCATWGVESQLVFEEDLKTCDPGPNGHGIQAKYAYKWSNLEPLILHMCYYKRIQDAGFFSKYTYSNHNVAPTLSADFTPEFIAYTKSIEDRIDAHNLSIQQSRLDAIAQKQADKDARIEAAKLRQLENERKKQLAADKREAKNKIYREKREAKVKAHMDYANAKAKSLDMTYELLPVASVAYMIQEGQNMETYEKVVVGCRELTEEEEELCKFDQNLRVLQDLEKGTLYTYSSDDWRDTNQFIIFVAKKAGSSYIANQRLDKDFFNLTGTFAYKTALGSSNTVLAFQRIK